MKRYNIEWGAHQEESKDGEWVLYEDAIAAVKAERERIHAIVDKAALEMNWYGENAKAVNILLKAIREQEECDGR